MNTDIGYLLETFSFGENTPPVQTSNVENFKKLLNGKNNNELVSVNYSKGDEIVTGGILNKKFDNEQLSYAYVPLAFILDGDITVIKGGKGLKKLSRGDFFGLFETSDFLLTGKTREIGDWTLVANTDVKVVFFIKSLLLEETSEADSFRKYLMNLAKDDHVPQPITNLSLLDWVASHTTKERRKDCVIIVHTHLLPNNRPLFRHLASLLDFGQMYVLDKPYSTVKSTFNELVWAGFEVVPIQMDANLPYEFAVHKSLDVLWRMVIDDQKKRNFKKLLIIDDGGDVWRSIPYKELGDISIGVVEQTQRGIARLNNSSLDHPPIVSVASAGIKKIVESRFIGESIVKKMTELGVFKNSKQVGIIGMGSIGIAIDDCLKKIGITALSYDPTYHLTEQNNISIRNSLDSLVNECDLLIGTTGTDALKGLPFDRIITGNKVLVSASSADLEFFSILKLANKRNDPFETVHIDIHEKMSVDVLNGGYPINFDREKDTTPDEDIVLTRCLMYIGAMQAIELIDENSKEMDIFGLDKVSQTKLLEKWIDYKKDLGQDPKVTKEEVKEIVDFTSLKDCKEMKTVWED